MSQNAVRNAFSGPVYSFRKIAFRNPVCFARVICDPWGRAFEIGVLCGKKVMRNRQCMYAGNFPGKKAGPGFTASSFAPMPGVFGHP